MENDHERERALPKYAMESGFRPPIHRVEPCVLAMTRKLAAVRWCCRMVLLDVDDTSPEGEALAGAVDVIADVERELYEAAMVLRREIDGGE